MTRVSDDALAVTLSVADLRKLMVEAATEAVEKRERRERDQAATLSLIGAARRAKRRTADVAAALTSGALPGVKEGRLWKVRADLLDTWAKGRR